MTNLPLKSQLLTAVRCCSRNSPVPRALRGEIVSDYLLRVTTSDGNAKVLCIDASPLRDPSGMVSGALIALRDVTGQHAAEDALRASQRRLQGVLDNTTMAVFVMDDTQRCVYANAAAEAMTGFSLAELQDRPLHDVIHHTHPDGRHYPLEECPIDRAFPENNQVQGFETFVHRDGSFYNVAFTASPVRDETSTTIGTIIEARNIDADLAVAREIEEGRAFLRELLNSTGEGFYAVDREGTTTHVNRAFLELLGFAREEDVIGRKLHDIIHHSHPDGSHYPKEHCPIYRAADTGEAAHVEGELFYHADGSPIPVEYRAYPIMIGGEHRGAICTFFDISERLATEAKLRETEERYRLAVRATNDAIWDWHFATNHVQWNETLSSAYGFKEVEVEPTGEWWIDHIHPEDRTSVSDSIHAAIDGAESAWSHEYRFRRADGSYAVVFDRGHIIRDATGRATRMIGAMLDLTQSRLAAAAVATSEERLRLATDAAEVGFWDVDLINDVLIWPPLVKAMFGISPNVSVSMADFYTGLHPDDRETTARAFAAACDPTLRCKYDVEYRTIGKEDGLVRWVAAKGTGIFDETGTCVRVIGAAIDITGRKSAEQELQALNAQLEERVAEEVERRAKAEEALRQAQKMEAIGQLTGGVAHDFNNLLTVIIGGLDRIQRSEPNETTRIQRAAEMSLQGARRAASLTSRLLAFSRRQALEPKSLDVNVVVRDMTDLLHRTLGEQVELEGVLSPRLWLIEADQNQLESAILNLAVNARDAMPEGGKLTIETSNAFLDDSYSAVDAEVIPGQYVAICVSDNGSGMSRDVIDRVFEPFFTTKEVGHGTGLGLSMVYGFVKQSRGHVTLYSEVGHGTTVKLYFPRFSGTQSAPEIVEIAGAPASRGEVILLVEDNDDVRAYSSMVLGELGYAVIEAAEAEAALRALRQDQRIDLLFTDVVLPGKSGRVLADLARQLRPQLKILFTTGYSRNAIVHHGRLDAGVNLISKPFTYEQLANRVREVLDQG